MSGTVHAPRYHPLIDAKVSVRADHNGESAENRRRKHTEAASRVRIVAVGICNLERAGSNRKAAERHAYDQANC
jgi:hypothetical protein